MPEREGKLDVLKSMVQELIEIQDICARSRDWKTCSGTCSNSCLMFVLEKKKKDKLRDLLVNKDKR
ncbi:hypothetical protein LCGC14_1958900 [marine sediment metagenome]|uniref:Uncharacterized protein n=1 Tax=marine sediment metagenome TaxID=412755 RepID=A0A0F9HTI8_9ZZZZ